MCLVSFTYFNLNVFIANLLCVRPCASAGVWGYRVVAFVLHRHPQSHPTHLPSRPPSATLELLPANPPPPTPTLPSTLTSWPALLQSSDVILALVPHKLVLTHQNEDGF